MKIRFFTILALTLTASPAFAWQKTLDCDGGKTVIDFNASGNSHRVFQLVIRDAETVRYLTANGGVQGSNKNSNGELVLPLFSTSDSEFTGDDDAYQSSGRVYFVKSIGDNLLLEAFRTSQPTGGMYVQHDKAVEWTFRGCRK